jgi:hypothetical protein
MYTNKYDQSFYHWSTVNHDKIFCDFSDKKGKAGTNEGIYTVFVI